MFGAPDGSSDGTPLGSLEGSSDGIALDSLEGSFDRISLGGDDSISLEHDVKRNSAGKSLAAVFSIEKSVGNLVSPCVIIKKTLRQKREYQSTNCQRYYTLYLMSLKILLSPTRSRDCFDHK